MKNFKNISLILFALTLGATIYPWNDNDPFRKLFDQMSKNFFNDPFFGNSFGHKDPFGSMFDNDLDDGGEYYVHRESGDGYDYIIITNGSEYKHDPRFTKLNIKQQPPQGPQSPNRPQQIPNNQIQNPPTPQMPPQTSQKPPQVQRGPNPQQTPFLGGGFFPFIGFGGDPSAMEQTPPGQTGPYNQYNADNQNRKVTFADVLGQKEAIEEIKEVVDFLKNPAKYKEIGAEIPKGILLYGPPGNGKTLLARAIAGEAECTFIHTSASNFVNKYVGTGADNIRKLFEQARKQAPAIVFVDEMDAIGNRESDENQEYRHTINELLTQLDGFTQDDNVVFICATNFKESIDKALLRPGRIDRRVEISQPTKSGRRDILNYYFKAKTFDLFIDKQKLAEDLSERTIGFSGAELKKLANEAALEAVRCGQKHIDIKNIEVAYDKILLGLSKNWERTKEQIEHTAYHEAGHTLVKLLTNQPVAKVSVFSRGDALGVTMGKEKYETTSDYSKEELLNKIMGSLGGYMAEKVVYESTKPGVSSDLKHASDIAHNMIKKWGMGNADLECLVYDNMQSDQMRVKFDNEISKLISECKKNTESIILANRELLNSLTQELLKKETLSEEEITEIASNYFQKLCKSKSIKSVVKDKFFGLDTKEAEKIVAQYSPGKNSDSRII